MKSAKNMNDKTKPLPLDNATIPQARVFISCGQRDVNEKQLGFACQRHFRRRGFKTYLAESVQDFEGLTDNIFAHLRTSEYAVFIDSKREGLGDGIFRGSLFVNQELAIAAFQQIESRVFHQKNVNREGVAAYLIAKPIIFDDKDDFLRKLRCHTAAWDPKWRNELSLTFLRKVPNVMTRDSQKLTDWYHLQVRNNHPTKYARNCVSYILKIKDLNTGVEIYPPNLELVWSGTFSVVKHILPKGSAEIDAFFIFHDSKVINFKHAEISSTQYVMPEHPQGTYLITYTVICENFEQVSQTFRMDFGGDYNSISFTPYDFSREGPNFGNSITK